MMAEPAVPVVPVEEPWAVSGDGPEPEAESGLGSLTGDLRELADNAQTLVEAELAYQSARAAYAWNRGRGIAIWLIIAATAGFFAVVALVVGLLLALIPYVGVWGSLAIVTLALVLVAVFALLRASAKFKRMRMALIADNPIQPPSGMVPAPLPQQAATGSSAS